MRQQKVIFECRLLHTSTHARIQPLTKTTFADRKAHRGPASPERSEGVSMADRDSPGFFSWPPEDEPRKALSLDRRIDRKPKRPTKTHVLKVQPMCNSWAGIRLFLLG
jgi:hypothetical protein